MTQTWNGIHSWKNTLNCLNLYIPPIVATTIKKPLRNFSYQNVMLTMSEALSEDLREIAHAK